MLTCGKTRVRGVNKTLIDKAEMKLLFKIKLILFQVPSGYLHEGKLHSLSRADENQRRSIFCN